jgi:hypothetical protein
LSSFSQTKEINKIANVAATQLLGILCERRMPGRDAPSSSNVNNAAGKGAAGILTS